MCGFRDIRRFVCVNGDHAGQTIVLLYLGPSLSVNSSPSTLPHHWYLRLTVLITRPCDKAQPGDGEQSLISIGVQAFGTAEAHE